MDDLRELREQLVLASKRAYRRGIQTGSGGNISARVPGKELMLVKASGSSFEDSTVDGFVITDFDGNLMEGTGKPTREALLHGYLYRICPQVDSVIHCHSPYCITWASTRKDLPQVTWHSQLKLCVDTPVIDVPAAVVKPEYFPLIKNAYDKHPNLPAFLLVDHGVVAVAKDPVNAEHTAELIEETAQIAFLESIAKRIEL